MKKDEVVKQVNTWEALLDAEYGKVGTPRRDAFEKKAHYFAISEMLKEARRNAKMTQKQLAEKVGTKRSYISRVENGNCDIQVSTLFKLFEEGLGRKLYLYIA
ncbi:MAG: helix-turn-helix transcriptional regulator [Chitinophagales bacterium]